MSESFTKLQNEKVESSLQTFQDGAIGSIQMLSTGFYGILEAFQSEMQKSRDIQEKIDQNTEQITSFQQDLSLCKTKCIELNDKLASEIKKMKKCLSDQSLEIDRKLLKFKEDMNIKCDSIKTECLSAVSKIENKVGKSLENVDRLKDSFENLEQEVNDQLRGLSVRCEENKELIIEQDNKFKDQLNELTEILHNKAIELDTKMENCLNETTEKIEKFDEKQQNFQFEINKELAQKADIQDLKHKLDINQYENFINNTFNSFNNKITENIKLIETNIDNSEQRQTEIFEDLNNMKTTQSSLKDMIDSKFAELLDKINNPVDINIIKEQIMESMIDSQESFKEDIVGFINTSLNKNDAPAFGSSSGNCIACGRGPSQFQPLPVKSPSPSKKPKHGGGFSRLPSRRKSISDAISASNTARRSLSGRVGSTDKLINNNDDPNKGGSVGLQQQQIMTSPKVNRRKSTSILNDMRKKSRDSNNKVTIDNDPIRVKIPDVNE